MHGFFQKTIFTTAKYLRANVCNFRESVDSREFLNFFIFCSHDRDRGARWKVGGLTIENNFFILKIEKRNKIIVFDLFLSRDFAYFIQYLSTTRTSKKMKLLTIYWNVYWSNSNTPFSLQVVVVFSAELTDFDEVPDNSNKRPTYTVSSDSMQEKTRLQF